MNERNENYPERVPLGPQDVVMQMRGYFEDMVGQPEFRTWESALDDIIEQRKLEKQKRGIIITENEPVTIQSQAEAVTRSLASRFKREDEKLKTESPEYTVAFHVMTMTAMNLEFMYSDQRQKNPSEAVDRELEKLKEYVIRL